MKIGIISNLSKGARVEDLRGYNRVVSFFLHRALRDAGVDAELSRDRDLPAVPRVDALVVVSASGIHRLREEPLPAGAPPLFLMTDGPGRGIRQCHRPSPLCRVGLGVDPGYCYPEKRGDGPPVVLFNAWNKLVKDGEPDAAQDAAVEELRRLVSIGRIRVWSQNFQLGFEERLWRTPGPGVGYLPWVEICKAYRGADIFLDCTPKVLELGRVEAAAAGCLILHQPTRPTSGITSLEWAPDNIREQIDLSISMDRDPERISKRAQRAFRWPDVAARVVDFIKEVL